VIWDERLGTKKVDEIEVMFGKKVEEIEEYDVTAGTESIKILKDVKEVDLTLRNSPIIFKI